MPGKIKVKVLAGRNLPVMDRASDTTDAFVEIKFGGVTHKTDVCRKSLNPHWNSTEWYRFEVDESELQDEPLQLRLMDHDTYSANDAIGKVVVSLAPLLAREANNARGAGPAGGAVMSGWIPVFDTMHGIRGELNIIVKVELFSDFNKYKTSSCGVQFFHCPSIPPGYRTTSIHGFVEELVVNDDPEYQWIDKIRTPRASNEARQVAFIKLSNQVQRLVGLKAAELGANAVVGYQQEFDLEGESGVVARAIGTAVSITPLPTPSHPMNIPPCTQQQLRKCLDILATDNETVTDLNEYYLTHQEELAKMISILNPKAPSMLDGPDTIDEDDEKEQPSRLSIHSFTGSMSLFQDDQIHHRSLRHLSEDQTDLNKLLNRRDDDDDDSDSSGTIQKIKKIKTNFFTKRFSKRKRDKKQKQDDQISIKSNSSDTSRISLIEIKNELKKRFKKPKIQKAPTNPDDEGVGMASILARSVIHAHTSLACITETQDSEQSAQENMRRTSESEPKINASDDEQIKISTDKVAELKNKMEGITVPDIQFSSLKNVSSDGVIPERVRKTSESCPSSPVVGRNENLLKLPGDKGYFDSINSALSGDSSEAYSSSEEEDESSELKTDSDEAIETTASVVNSVLNHKVNPAFIAQMERKLTTLEAIHPTTSDNSADPQIQDKKEKNDIIQGDNMFKVSDKDITVGIANDPQKQTEITPPSSKPSTSAQDSDNKHHGKKETSPDCKSGSLVHTAMQTMLMDRAQSVMPDTPEPIPIRMEPVFERGNRSRKTSENSESSGMVHSAMQTILMDKFKAVIPNTTEPIPVHLEEDSGSKHSKKNDKHLDEACGLVHSAMQTILIDKVQTVLPDTKEPVHIHIDDNYNKMESDIDSQAKELSGFTQSAIQTMLIEKVQTVLPDTIDPIPIHLEDSKSPNHSDNLTGTDTSTGLVNSALETILIEKVQSVLPDTPGPISVHVGDKSFVGNTENKKMEPESLLVLGEAILLEKVQTSIVPETSVVADIIDELTVTQNVDRSSDSKELVKTSMETTLLEKVQTVYPNSTDPDLINDVPLEDIKEQFGMKSVGNSEGSEEVKTAMQTNLFDEVQNSAGALDNISLQFKPTNTDLKSPALVETAMKTILLDKVQSAIATTDTNESFKILMNTTTQDSEKDKEISKFKKLMRQDSIHSMTETKESIKMSNEDPSNSNPSNITRPPVLQNFHPILSGLETIPSMSESSFERSVDGESSFETNSASVCDNSHAACGFDRSERDRDRSEKDRGSPRHARHESYGGKEPVGPMQAQPQASLNSTSTPMGIHRRSSDSDLSVTPKGGSLNTSVANVGSGGGAILRPSMNTDNLDMLEYPFLTMTEYPPGFIVHIGGTVCARSVKLVDGGGESAARAAWWAELRTELRAHARALRCNAVIAYCDTCSICEDVCVLSASGTAAVINLDCDYNVDVDAPLTVSNGNKPPEDEVDTCSIAHVPYTPGAGPYTAELSSCGGCKKARVPAVLLATCTKPNRLMSYTKAVTLTAVAGRVRRAGPGAEPGARDISDQLPFLEYELHRLLLAKLRMQGANALFNLSTQVALGERCVVALASGIAVKLHALPPPTPPTIKAIENDKEALELQRKLWDSFTANKAANGYDIAGLEPTSNGAAPELEREDPPTLDLCADKDACVLELDEAEDVSTARALCVLRSHVAAYTPCLKPALAPPYAFAQVSRARLTLSQQGGACAAAERHVARALDIATYKLRRLQPAAVAATFQLELPEDEIQLVVSGTAIPLLDPCKDTTTIENGNIASQGVVSTGAHNGTGDGDDDIFTLDEEQLIKSNQVQDSMEDKSPLNGTIPTSVSLTTLNHVAGVRALRRVCALRLLFVRETTAVRELGGLSGFLHTFTCEVLAIARAYTAALGGNALTSFYIRQLMLQDNAHKNQGQCLMSVGGDIVHITY